MGNDKSNVENFIQKYNCITRITVIALQIFLFGKRRLFLHLPIKTLKYFVLIIIFIFSHFHLPSKNLKKWRKLKKKIKPKVERNMPILPENRKSAIALISRTILLAIRVDINYV